MDFFVQLIPTLIFFLFGLLPAWMILKLSDFKHRKKKSPLNIKLLRNPGYSLQNRIDDITTDIFLSLLFIPITALMFYAVILQSISHGKGINIFSILIYGGAAFVPIGYFVLKTYKLVLLRNKLRVGLECEIAVGQDLLQLLRHDFRIFHDFPAEQFNIDHIAIGPSGVFAIETKGRAKFVKKEKENWKVEFSEQKLKFPGWMETAPLDQARRQAHWLKNWIQQSTGENISVVPVLALPGWYIRMKEKSDVRIYNGRNCLFMSKGNTVLSDKQIQSISFQVERMCKDVKALSYKKPESGKR